MSYCRFSDGDVYIYSSGKNLFTLHLNDNIIRSHSSLEWFWDCAFKNQIEVLAALQHIKSVAPETIIPDEAIERLQFEARHGLSGSIQENIDKTLEILSQRWVDRN